MSVHSRVDLPPLACASAGPEWRETCTGPFRPAQGLRRVRRRGKVGRRQVEEGALGKLKRRAGAGA